MLCRCFLIAAIPITTFLTLLTFTGLSFAGGPPGFPAGATYGGVHGADAHHSRNGSPRLVPSPWSYRLPPYFPRYGYRGFGYGPIYVPIYTSGFYGGFEPYYVDASVPADPGVRPPPMPPPPPALSGTRTAAIEVQVPADAVVFIEGVKMKTPGAVRRFTTPPLPEGESYRYEIRATWKENGREVSQTHQLAIRAGDRKSIIFFAGEVASRLEK